MKLYVKYSDGVDSVYEVPTEVENIIETMVAYAYSLENTQRCQFLYAYQKVARALPTRIMLDKYWNGLADIARTGCTSEEYNTHKLLGLDLEDFLSEARLAVGMSLLD